MNSTQTNVLPNPERDNSSNGPAGPVLDLTTFIHPGYDPAARTPSQDVSPYYPYPQEDPALLNGFPQVIAVQQPTQSLYNNAAFLSLIAAYSEERVLQAIQPIQGSWNDEDEVMEYLPSCVLNDEELWENATNDERMAIVMGFTSIHYADPGILDAFTA